MESHPLLQELLNICETHNINVSNAYLTFDVYFELSEVKKVYQLEYSFNEDIKLFYLTGKKEVSDEVPDLYIPVLADSEISLELVEWIQENICKDKKEFCLVIRDRDSSSTYYNITKGLVKPDSPEECKNKKEVEGKKYNLNKILKINKKTLYTKAVKRSSPEIKYK